MLEQLGGFRGNEYADGASYDARQAFGHDPDKGLRERMWRIAYLGRYAHQQATTIERMEVAEVWALVREVAELLSKEKGAGAMLEWTAGGG